MSFLILKELDFHWIDIWNKWTKNFTDSLNFDVFFLCCVECVQYAFYTFVDTKSLADTDNNFTSEIADKYFLKAKLDNKNARER